MAESWKSPASVIAIFGLAISLTGNIYQYYSTDKKIDFEIEKANKEFALEREKWEREKLAWDAEQEEKKLTGAEKDKLRNELKDVKAALQVWDDNLFQDNVELAIKKNELRTMTNKFQIATQKANIKVIEDAIEIRKSERERVVNRQNEIERLLMDK